MRAAIYGGRDLKRTREIINQVLKWKFERGIMAHGAMIPRDGKRILRRAMRWL